MGYYEVHLTKFNVLSTKHNCFVIKTEIKEIAQP